MLPKFSSGDFVGCNRISPASGPILPANRILRGKKCVFQAVTEDAEIIRIVNTKRIYKNDFST